RPRGIATAFARHPTPPAPPGEGGENERAPGTLFSTAFCAAIAVSFPRQRETAACKGSSRRSTRGASPAAEHENKQPQGNGSGRRHGVAPVADAHRHHLLHLLEPGTFERRILCGLGEGLLGHQRG